MLIGNKLDLIESKEQERCISEEKVKEFVEKHKLLYQETSAKTGFNVKESFEELIESTSFTNVPWEKKI